MDPSYLWDLCCIIVSAAVFERQFMEAQVSAFSAWQGHVGENPRKAIREAMEMNRLLERLLVTPPCTPIRTAATARRRIS